MITTIEERKVKTTGLINTKEMGISDRGNDKVFIIDALSTNLYSDSILAGIRELSTNANDAHIMAGCPEKPFEVWLPTIDLPEFRVRDYGTGLSDTQVGEVFQYGHSTKREDAETNGYLGLGSKSPFAYTDSFSIVSRYRGVKLSYVYYRNEERMPTLSLLSEESTDEASGLEISYAVNTYDIYTFRDRASSVYRYFPVKPTVYNVSDLNMEPRNASLEGEGWRLLGSSYTSYAIMGNVAYPIDAGQFEKDVYKTLLGSGVELYFDNGAVKFAPSREALLYGAQTKEAIEDKLITILAEIGVRVQKEFKSCQTLWEAKKMWGTCFKTYGSIGERVKEGLRGKIKWQGIAIEDTAFKFPEEDNVVKRAHPAQKGKVEIVDCSRIDTNDINYLFYNDSYEKFHVVKARFMTFFQSLGYGNSKRAAFFDWKDDDEKEQWIKDNNFQGVAFEKISEHDVFKKPVSEVEKNKKHTTKCFKWKGDETYPASAAWEVAEMDLENGEGIYVIIDHFKVKGVGRYTMEPSNFSETFNNIKNLLGMGIEVYGVKVSQIEKKPLGKGWKTLKEYTQEGLTGAKWDKVRDLSSRQKLAGSFYGKMGVYLKWVGKKDQFSGLMKDFLNELDSLDLVVEEDGNYKFLYNFNTVRDYVLNEVPKELPLFDQEGWAKKIGLAYPLVNLINISEYHHDEVSEYIRLIDGSRNKLSFPLDLGLEME